MQKVKQKIVLRLFSHIIVPLASFGLARGTKSFSAQSHYICLLLIGIKLAQ